MIRSDRVGSGDWRVTALMGVFVTATLVFGEMAALRALEVGRDSFFLHGLTVIALVYGFVFIFAQATKLILLGRERELSGRRKEALGRFYGLMVVVALVVSYAILYPELWIFGTDF